MVKVKVISIRQAIKNIFNIYIYIVCLLIIMILVIFTIFISNRAFEKASENSFNIFDTKKSYSSFSKILESELTVLSLIKSEEIKIVNKPQSEVKNELLITNNSIQSEELNTSENIEIQVIPNIKYDFPKKFDVFQNSNGNITVGNSTITNYSKLNLDLVELSKPLNFKISQSNKFLIVHTHATESYTVPNNKSIVNYRTTDKNYNMILVGDKLTSELESRGFDITHDETLHDYPNYNGSYQACLNTIQKHITNEDYDFVLDVHRDALSSNLGYRPTVKINGEKAAQLMFVVGTNASGLSHDKWMDNLKLALLIQNRANEMYPGLFRNLNLSKSRYNQHVSTGALIVEVGATGNTLEEAQTSMKYLANVINSFK